MLWLRPSGNGKAEAYDGNNDLQLWRNNPHYTDINLLLPSNSICRDSVGFKDGWFPYRLTAKLTENAVAGATLLMTQPQPEALGALPPAGEGAELQGAYCQLCASILISFMRKVISMPEADASP